MIKIIVEKNPEPIITPSMCHGKVSSTRNPAAVRYNGKYILLCTVRSHDNISRLHLARSNDGKNFTIDKNPFIDIDKDSKKGVEDARIVKIGNEYYITFTAFKGRDKNEKEEKINTTRIGLVKTKNFKTYYSRKIILDEYGNNKNCVIFQNQNSSEFYVIHRPILGKPNEKFSAHLARTKDFENWEHLGIFLEPRENMWDSARVGVNTPPIKIGNKLLFLYHGAEEKTNIYSIGGILVDEKNPQEILWRSQQEPIISPELSWETGKCEDGAEVPMVVFGQGIVPSGKEKDSWEFFYGGADKYIGKARIKIIQDPPKPL